MLQKYFSIILFIAVSTSVFFWFGIAAKVTTVSFVTPLGEKDTVRIRVDAIKWVENNFRGLELLTLKQKLPLYYISSLFLDRIGKLEGKQDFYDELYLDKAIQREYPFFVKEGIDITIMADDKKLIDFEQYAQFRGVTVETVYGDAYKGDLRLMDTIRGEAGRRSIYYKGNKLSDFPKGHHNTFYHEFAHFIHFTTLTKSEFMRIRELYIRAKKRNKFLDAYADNNFAEYFSQGLECFVSETKTKKNKEWPSHSCEKDKLKRVDPELHQLIESLIEKY